MATITFTKVKLPYGWLGNMDVRYPVQYENKLWPSTEHLFQALRFAPDDPIRETIRQEPNPFKAKLIAKRQAARMIITPCSTDDLNNMRLCLRLKVEQHPALKQALIDTGDALIIEDCTKRRASPWGCQFKTTAEDGKGEWVGTNYLGRLWMELRHDLTRKGTN